jgi:hypothetical protein
MGRLRKIRRSFPGEKFFIEDRALDAARWVAAQRHPARRRGVERLFTKVTGADNLILSDSIGVPPVRAM